MMYSVTLQLKSRDVNRYRRFRTSRFMEIVQECSIAHTTALGFGREKTLDRGLLWMIVQQHFHFFRVPSYDEKVTMTTWPGKMEHLLFPRFYRLTSAASGEKLAEGSAVWVLCSAETRSAVFPEKYGVRIEADSEMTPLPLPRMLRSEGTGTERDFTVPFSWCDLNGHMNNTKYFDLLEDVYPPAENWQLGTVDAEYHGETLFNRTYRMETLRKPESTAEAESVTASGPVESSEPAADPEKADVSEQGDDCDADDKTKNGSADIRMITLKDEQERILCRVRMAGTARTA